MRVLFFLTFSLLMTAAHAETVDVNIGRNDARIGIQGPLKRLVSGAQGLYDTALLTNRDDNRPRLVQGHAGALLTGDVGAKETPVQAGLGGRLVFEDAGSGTSGSAFALGGQVEVRAPQMNRLGLFTHLYFAPNATSFSSLDRYREFAIAADYQVIRQASAYLGYRNVNYRIKDRAFTVDNGWHLGVRLIF